MSLGTHAHHTTQGDILVIGVITVVVSVRLLPGLVSVGIGATRFPTVALARLSAGFVAGFLLLPRRQLTKEEKTQRISIVANGPDMAWDNPDMAWDGPDMAWDGPDMAWDSPDILATESLNNDLSRLTERQAS